MNRSIICLLAAGLALSACATRGERSAPSQGVDNADEEARAGYGAALLAPAEDLNIKRDEIPEVLKELKQVYVLPEDLAGTHLTYTHRDDVVDVIYNGDSFRG